MARIYYWRDILGNTALFEPYADILQQLKEGNYHALSLEKLQCSTGVEIYSIRVDRKTRILFTTYQQSICLLDVVLNHRYDKSRFLKKPFITAMFMNKQVEAGTFTRIPISGEVLDEVLKTSSDDGEQTINPLDFYQRKLIEFNTSQQAVLQMRLPAIVSGPAGSGKSCVALSLLAQYVRNLTLDDEYLPIAYITHSARLVREMERNWHEMDLDGRYADSVVFKTYDELLIEQTARPAESIVNDTHFYVWYGSVQHKKEGVSEKELWYEFRIRSGYSDDDSYLHLGSRESSLSLDARAEACRLYHRYLTYLESTRLLSATLHLNTASVRTYEMMVIDEAQDLSFAQLSSLNAWASGAILYLLGEHQILFDGKSRLNYLTKMLYQNGMTPNILRLPATYRCPIHVMAVANALIQLKYRATGGAADKLESDEVHVGDHLLGAGETHWITQSESDALRTWQDAAQHNDFAVVTHKDYLCEVRTQFDTPLIFTFEEIKGLEYNKILLWRPFDCEEAIQACMKLQTVQSPGHTRHRAKAGASDEVHQPFFNAVLTAVTRTKQTLVMVQNHSHHLRVFIDELYPVFTNMIDSVSMTSHVNNWEAEAQRLLEAGQIAQAHAILEKKLHHNTQYAASLIPLPMPEDVAGAAAGRALSEEENSMNEAMDALRYLLKINRFSLFKKTAKYTKLMTALRDKGRDGIEKTFLFQSMQSEETFSLLRKLQVDFVNLFRQIPAELWTRPCVFAGQNTTLKDVWAGKSEETHVETVPLVAQPSTVKKISKKRLCISSILHTSEGAMSASTAAEKGYVVALIEIYNQGVDFTQCLPNGQTLAHIAAQHNQPAVLVKLHELGIDLSRTMSGMITLAHVAAAWGSVDVLTELHRLHIDLNSSSSVINTPLFMAVNEGHIAAMQKLHELGVDLNQTMNDGTTVVHIAVNKGDINMLKELHRLLGVFFNRITKKRSPLYIAVRENQLEVVKFLIQAGADINSRFSFSKEELWELLCEDSSKPKGLYEKIKNHFRSSDTVMLYSIIDLAEIMNHKEIANYLNNIFTERENAKKRNEDIAPLSGRSMKELRADYAGASQPVQDRLSEKIKERLKKGDLYTRIQLSSTDLIWIKNGCNPIVEGFESISKNVEQTSTEILTKSDEMSCMAKAMVTNGLFSTSCVSTKMVDYHAEDETKSHP